MTDRRYTLELRPAAVRQLRKLPDEALVITVVRVANRREVYRGI